MNIPNTLTMARFVFSIIIFVILPFGWYLPALVLFLLATATDWLDGWWARKFDLVTQFGRIFDPLADKTLICGSFIYLLAEERLQQITLPCCPNLPLGLAAWMVTVIVLRELVVTVLRSFVEGSGGDFSAKWIGKWKMALQCVAVATGLLSLSLGTQVAPESFTENLPDCLRYTFIVSLWGTVLLTLYSGIVYVRAAATFFK